MIKLMRYFKLVKSTFVISLSMAVLFTAAPAGARWDELINPQTPYAGPVMQEQEVAASSPQGIYRVKRGETLSSIAHRLGFSAARLAAMNSISNKNRIFEGQILRLPSSIVEHRVVAGETLSGIATEYGVGMALIASCNNIKDYDAVTVGTRLSIPAQGKQSARSAADRSIMAGQLPWPVTGWVSSPFGFRDGRMHEGLDIAADSGDPIKAVSGGRVIFAGTQDGYGLTVIIDHGDGISTLYGHCSKLLVKRGERVASGQLIARVGSTGRSSGPHLHLEVRLNGVPHDPLQCLQRTYA